MDITIDATRQQDRSYIIKLNEYELQFLEKAVDTLNKKRESSRANYSKRYGTQPTRTNLPRVNILRSDMATISSGVRQPNQILSLNILPTTNSTSS